MKQKTNYDSEVLGCVAYEFTESDRAESERKIRRRLRDKTLGPFDQERVEKLRALKTDVKREIDGTTRSRFFLGQHGKYVDYRDWDIGGMNAFMEARHSAIDAGTIESFIPFAILIYYLK